jgi:hypothetical protein
MLNLARTTALIRVRKTIKPRNHRSLNPPAQSSPYAETEPPEPQPTMNPAALLLLAKKDDY